MNNAAIVQQTECAAFQPQDGGPKPTSPLQLQVRPIPFVAAKILLEREHYLHSLPGGTKLAFGVFMGQRLMGALTLGAGPSLGYHLVEGARIEDCLTLTRLWLSDELPPNSESRILGVAIRALRRHTSVKFLLAYSDPAMGHVGTIYQAAGWLYTGLSSATSLYDIGDGKARHSRSVAQILGSHSIKHFARYGLEIKLVPQERKHRYVYFLDPAWRSRLEVPILPYPKREVNR